MTQTIQKKISMFYSLWLFVIFVLIAGYILITGNVFMEYAAAVPWIYGYIAVAVLGNIGVLIGIYYYLDLDSSNVKLLIIYEVLFVLILLVTYLVIAREMLPTSIGNINFETILNAVLPISFILLMLAEFVFTKAIRAMPSKNQFKTVYK